MSSTSFAMGTERPGTGRALRPYRSGSHRGILHDARHQASDADAVAAWAIAGGSCRPGVRNVAFMLSENFVPSENVAEFDAARLRELLAALRAFADVARFRDVRRFCSSLQIAFRRAVLQVEALFVRAPITRSLDLPARESMMTRVSCAPIGLAKPGTMPHLRIGSSLAGMRSLRLEQVVELDLRDFELTRTSAVTSLPLKSKNTHFAVASFATFRSCRFRRCSRCAASRPFRHRILRRPCAARA